MSPFPKSAVDAAASISEQSAMAGPRSASQAIRNDESYIHFEGMKTTSAAPDRSTSVVSYERRSAARKNKVDKIPAAPSRLTSAAAQQVSLSPKRNTLQAVLLLLRDMNADELVTVQKACGLLLTNSRK